MNNRKKPSKDEPNKDEQTKLFDKCFADLSVEEHMILKAYFGPPPSSRRHSLFNPVSDLSSDESEIELNDPDSEEMRPVKRSRSIESEAELEDSDSEENRPIKRSRR